MNYGRNFVSFIAFIMNFIDSVETILKREKKKRNGFAHFALSPFSFPARSQSIAMKMLEFNGFWNVRRLKELRSL